MTAASEAAEGGFFRSRLPQNVYLLPQAPPATEPAGAALDVPRRPDDRWGTCGLSVQVTGARTLARAGGVCRGGRTRLNVWQARRRRAFRSLDLKRLDHHFAERQEVGF